MSFKRFVNLVFFNYEKHLYSLRRLNPDGFFYPRAEAATHGRQLPIQGEVHPCGYLGITQANGKKPAASPELLSIRVPPVLFSVRPTPCPLKDIDQPNLHSFTLSERKIFFADSVTRLFYYDIQKRCVVTTPNLHAPKSYPFALSVPRSTDAGEQNHSLYIMEKILSPAKEDQFEALFCRERQRKGSGHGKAWYRETLPLPPYVHGLANKHASILCYAVVGEAICISVSGVGTYCFDMVKKTWNLAGDWLMPFMGKAEYIPELKLWFGMSDGQLPCAADLSPVLGGHAPGKEYIWGDPDVPDEWNTAICSPAEIISLGSGRFCIVNFFETMHLDDVDREFAVFTGVEVTSENLSVEDGSKSGGSGTGMLRMIKHKSQIYDSTTNIIKSVH